MANSLPKIAIVYSFDGALTALNPDQNSFISPLGRKPGAFWDKLYAEAGDQESKCISMYMQKMIGDPRGKVQIRRENLRKHGSTITLFPGVEQWFSRISDVGRGLGFNVQHVVFSSGLREIIEGTPLSGDTIKIYASEYSYDCDGAPLHPSIVISQEEKIQYLLDISARKINAAGRNDNQISTAQTIPEIPFDRIIMMGGDALDADCLRTVTERGGTALAVYRPHTQRAQRRAQALQRAAQANFVVSGDYGEGKAIEQCVTAVMERMAAERKVAALAQSSRAQIQSGKPSDQGGETHAEGELGAEFVASCGTASPPLQSVEDTSDEVAPPASGSFKGVEALLAGIGWDQETPSSVNQAQP